jgi:uncharacterized membrane-anchored protein YhcB (DUF1043 family)
MAWRNRIATGRNGRSQGFRKMSFNDEDYEMPLLVRSSSASLSPRSNHSPSGNMMGSLAFTGFTTNSPKSNGSVPAENFNIAAVSDDIEALAFPDHNKKNADAGTDRTSNNSSPLSMLEDNTSFVAQFRPDVNVIGIIDEKSESAAGVTVFDDNTSNDGSMFTTSKEQNDCEEYDEVDEVHSLRPPSITMEENQDEKKETNSTNEDPNAASWKADEIDAFINSIGFGNSTRQMEISGIDLLTERDSSVNELLEVNHLMTFNSLVLIQKQREWIAGSIDATKGANKGCSSLISMELQNLERKIRLLMDNKAWPNELERRKQQANPFTPAKAFFKSMALIDKSIEQFHKGYLKYMSDTSEENHDLKTRVDKLVEVNASLQDLALRSSQKTETIRKLQKERDNLTRMVESTDQVLASFLINEGRESSNNPSKLQRVKSYIQRLETERNAHLAEIQSLKRSFQNATESEDDIEVTEASSVCVADENSEKEDVLDDSSPITTQVIDDETSILNDDLGSKWHTLGQNEAAMTSKDDRIKSLSETVAGQESALESVRAECKLMRMQLLQLETTRNEFKSQCELKDSALTISQDRISSLEEEVLRTHVECATYEEDYEAMKQSFATQKVATKQEISNSQEDVKTQVDYIREEFEEKLKRSEEQLKKVEEDRKRVVRDLKTSVDEIEAERDNLRIMLIGHTATPMMEEEKKESEEDMLVVTPPVSPKSSAESDYEHLSRFVEKASKQAFAIAQLTEENEIKDVQLKSLQEMVEMLLGQRNGEGELLDEENNKRPWGQRISNLRAKSQQRASDLLTRSRHGSKHDEECTN